MTHPFDVRRAFAAAAIMAMIVSAGCQRTPEAPRTSGSETAAPAVTDHDHGHDHDHEHADHDHDHGDHAQPRTLSEGTKQLAALAASVKQHLAAEAREDADAMVHELGHLLEDLPELVRTSDLAVDAKAAATKALDELSECFMAVDESLHGEPGQGKPPAEVHASVAKQIEAAIAALESAGAAKAAAVEDDAAAIIREAQGKTGRDEK